MHAQPLADLVLVALQRQKAEGSALPLHRQLYFALRGAILSNQLPPHVRLQSTRSLADDLKISRNTVMSAIEQLIAEGYLTAQTGSGTFVADALPESRVRAKKSRTIVTTQPDSRLRQLSRRGTAITASSGADDYEVQPFAPGAPDYAEFPSQIWQRLQNRHWHYLRRDLLDYGQHGGWMPLRQALQEYLHITRAVKVAPEQILITSGTQQSLDLCARLSTDEGDIAWLENPCYWGAKRALTAAGLQLRPIPVDQDGMNPSDADWASDPRLIYITPSHQYPLGHVMSLARRRSLLAFAAQKRCWIFEDDYDSEFRYNGYPIAALQGLDQHAQVFYSGTFSKTMYPGIRLGYLIVPPDLIERFNTGLYDLYRPGQLMLQAALADFMREGHLTTLVRRLRVSYRQRRDELATTLTQELGSAISISGGDSGLHLAILFNPEIIHTRDTTIAERCQSVSISVRPLSRYYLAEPIQQGLVCGYAYVPQENIGQWVKKLCQVIQETIVSSRKPSGSNQK